MHLFNYSLLLIDAINKIIDETCIILNCERASVFIIDYQRQKLITKAAKGQRKNFFFLWLIIFYFIKFKY